MAIKLPVKLPFNLRLALRTKLILGTVIASVSGVLLSLLLLSGSLSEILYEPLSGSLTEPVQEQGSQWGGLALILLTTISLSWAMSYFVTRKLATSLMALEVGLLNFKDNDFSISIPVSGDEQLSALATLFNESAASLRQERQYIYQRELLLDKVIQSSPNVMLLLDDDQRVIYANDAARHLFNRGTRIEGLNLTTLLESVSDELARALQNPKGGLFSLAGIDEGEDETWHLSRGQFLLNGQYHHLLLLKQMTHELNRQEVAVWKKVIRIISHELNNSVAPIASMVNSGRMITRELNDPKLKMIFDTIEDRTNHLSQFIFNYARFAKLPLPKKSVVDWHKLTEQLGQHYAFKLKGKLPDSKASLDLIQMEQVLLNLLKNAHESGSEPEGVTLSIEASTLVDGTCGISIEINDEGAGMSPEVLKQALLPFYSTKQSGTGLGLPLCREIIEAHDGRISLHNRDDVGLCVRVWLPQ